MKTKQKKKNAKPKGVKDTEKTPQKNCLTISIDGGSFILQLTPINDARLEQLQRLVEKEASRRWIPTSWRDSATLIGGN